MQSQLARARREELLDGLMAIMAARGFADVRLATVARELHCSLGSLYKIAPNKDSLVVLAIERWGERTLSDAEADVQQAHNVSDRAKRYWQSTAESLRPLSRAFRRDVERFDSARLTYRVYSDRFVDRFTALLGEAAQAGEIRPVNARFLAGLFRYIAMALRDEDLLETAGLTATEAAIELDSVIWEGLQPRTSDKRRTVPGSGTSAVGQ